MNLPAQDSTYVKVKPNELSFGFYNVFQINESPNFGLLYKRRIKKGAIMVGSKFHVSNRKNEYDDNESSSEYNGYSVNPRFGYEFHLNIKRGQVFYGAELTFLFIYTEHTNYYSPSSSIEYNEDINKVMIYGLRPMIGLKYQINRWLSVSTETAVNFSYNTSENHSKTIYTDDTSDQEQNRKSQGFSVWLEPLGLLSINFHF